MKPKPPKKQKAKPKVKNGISKIIDPDQITKSWIDKNGRWMIEIKVK